MCLPPRAGAAPRGSAGGPEGRLHTGRAAPSPGCRQRNRAAPPGPLGVLGRVPAGFLRGLLHRAALPRRSESRARLPPSRLTRAAPPKSTCQSQRRFRPARPGRVAPGRPRRAQCGRQAGRASWSPPSRRPSGRPGRAPGSDARSGGSWLLPRTASCQRWYRGAPAARRLVRLWRGGSGEVILAPGLPWTRCRAGQPVCPTCKWGRRWSPPHRAECDEREG